MNILYIVATDTYQKVAPLPVLCQLNHATSTACDTSITQPLPCPPHLSHPKYFFIQDLQRYNSSNLTLEVWNKEHVKQCVQRFWGYLCLVWLFAQAFRLELEGYLLMRPPIKRAPQGTHRGYYHSTPLTEASRLLHLTNSSKINGVAAPIPRLLLYKACFVAKIYILWCASTIHRFHCVFVTQFMGIYGSQGEGFLHGGGVGNTHRQTGSSAVKRTK